MRSKSLGKNGITLTIFPHSLSLEVIIVKKKQKRHSESGTFRPDLLAASKRKSIWEGGDGKVPKGVKAPMAPAMFNPPMPARSSGRPWESCQRGGPSARCNKASVFTAAASWRRWIFATCSYRMMKMFQLKWTSSIAISCANQKETLEVISILKKQRFRIAMANFLYAANISNQTNPSFVLGKAIILPWKQLVLVFPLVIVWPLCPWWQPCTHAARSPQVLGHHSATSPWDLKSLVAKAFSQPMIELWIDDLLWRSSCS